MDCSCKKFFICSPDNQVTHEFELCCFFPGSYALTWHDQKRKINQYRHGKSNYTYRKRGDGGEFFFR